MAGKVIGIGLAAVLVALLCTNAIAQSSGCTSAIIGLAPCLNFITGNSSTPSTSCCTQLGSVVQNQPQCLCSLLNGGGSSFGIAINQTQALALPAACNVKTPPISQCNAAAPAIPPSTPATPSTPSVPSNPTPTTSTTPSTPSTPSVPSGSKDVPSGQSSNGSSNKSGNSVMFPIFFIGACFLSLTSL